MSNVQVTDTATRIEAGTAILDFGFWIERQGRTKAKGGNNGKQRQRPITTTSTRTRTKKGGRRRAETTATADYEDEHEDEDDHDSIRKESDVCTDADEGICARTGEE
jgi:hypothetical protein